MINSSIKAETIPDSTNSDAKNALYVDLLHEPIDYYWLYSLNYDRLIGKTENTISYLRLGTSYFFLDIKENSIIYRI